MTRSELIAELAAAHTQLRDEHVETIVAAIFDGIAAALARGARVELRGFGAFSVRRRDPRTGEAVAVDAKSVPFLRAGKETRLRMNAGKIAHTDGKRR